MHQSKNKNRKKSTLIKSIELVESNNQINRIESIELMELIKLLKKNINIRLASIDSIQQTQLIRSSGFNCID